MAKIDNPTTENDTEETVALPDDLAQRAKGMNIHAFTPKRKLGKYDDEVQTLIAVDEASGQQNSIEILVPSADEAKKYKKWFSDSARAFGKSARIVNGDLGTSQGENAGVILEFVLTEQVKRTVKPKVTEAAPDAA